MESLYSCYFKPEIESEYPPLLESCNPNSHPNLTLLEELMVTSIPSKKLKSMEDTSALINFIL